MHSNAAYTVDRNLKDKSSFNKGSRMKFLVFVLALSAAVTANAQSIQCSGANGVTVSVASGIINTKSGETGPGDTHTASVKKDGKTKSYSVHATSEGTKLVLASYMGFNDVRFKLDLENYTPANTSYSNSSVVTLKRVLVDVKDPETGELKWTTSERVKSEYSVNCKVSGTFAFRNACEGKSKAQLNEQLLQAARSANIELAEKALTCGADVNFQDKNGCTALISVVENEKAVCRKDKYPSLDPIFQNRASFLAEMFMDAGAYYDTKDKNGSTALHRAISNPILADEQVLKLLINLEADLNVQDNDGLTPLMLAAKLGLESPVYALVNAGADTSLKDKKGRTAYDLGEKLYPKWIRDMLAGVSKEFVITGANSTCSPLSLLVPKGERVRLKLVATDNMYMLSVPGLAVNIMASADGSADQVIEAAAGPYTFECGLHGGAQSKGSIVAK